MPTESIGLVTAGTIAQDACKSSGLQSHLAQVGSERSIRPQQHNTSLAGLSTVGENIKPDLPDHQPASDCLEKRPSICGSLDSTPLELSDFGGMQDACMEMWPVRDQPVLNIDLWISSVRIVEVSGPRNFFRTLKYIVRRHRLSFCFLLEPIVNSMKASCILRRLPFTNMFALEARGFQVEFSAFGNRIWWRKKWK